MSHDVNINEDAILSELDQMAAEPPGQQQGTSVSGEVVPAEQPQQIPREYIMAGQMIIGMFANRMAPNWPIDAEMQKDWAESFAACANELAPGGLGNIDNWGPWAKLAFASGMVAVAGLDMQTMTIRPMQKPDPKKQQQQQQARPGEFVTGGQPGGGGEFTTAGH